MIRKRCRDMTLGPVWHIYDHGKPREVARDIRRAENGERNATFA